MTRSRDSRREAARARERSSSTSRLLIPAIAVAVVIVAAVAAIALTGGSAGGASSTLPPTASAGSSGSSAGASAGASGSMAGAPVISGTPLPKYQRTGVDHAVGMTIPTVEGANFAGQPVSIALDGKPKVILLLAHWCPHCQAEVPLIQKWLDGGGAPEGVELISVATAIDPTYPNYPPEAWLAREGWTMPVIVDRPPGSVATAYGVSAFPFWTFVNADGTVKGRTTGELPIADMETIIASLGR